MLPPYPSLRRPWAPNSNAGPNRHPNHPQAMGVVRIFDAFYTSLVLLNGCSTASLVFGPRSWGLIFALCAPTLISMQLSTLLVRDFATMYAN